MRSLVASLLVAVLLTPAGVRANPKGGKIVRGSGSIQNGIGRVDVHQLSKDATLTWDSFDIAAGEVTQFHQPGSDAVAINRIFQGDASKILGSLQANGHVYLINPHGVLFGREAQVNVHALIATTTVDGSDLARSGGFDVSAQAVPGAQIVNEGSITAGAGGFVYLVAPYVKNGRDGVIVSPEGQVMIEGGAKVFLTDRADGTGFAVQYETPPGTEAVNLGRIFADGGFARLRGQLVLQAGTVQANSIREKDGVIELVADDELTLASGSVTRAAGGADAGSHAGTVDAWSDGTSIVEEGALVDVSARAQAANGGFAEVSAKKRVEIEGGSFHAGAGTGGQRGELLFDPEDIVIGGDSKFVGASRVTFAADRKIEIESGAQIDLARQPGGGPRSGRQRLELVSGGDIVFARDALIEDTGTGKTWDVDIRAGESATASRAPRDGDIVFEGGRGSGIRLSRGNLRGVAAGDVVLNDGSAMSSIDGDVEVAADGDVIFDAGRTPGVDTVIESGSGDVRVVAGGSVLLQSSPGTGGNAAIRTRGVYGIDGDGNVTKTDGGDVLVWAKTGDVDAGVANRWVEPPPSVQGNGPERDSGLPPGPDFDPIPVADANNQHPNSERNRGAGDGVLGIGTEAGGNVVVIAGNDVRTHATTLQRDGGTAQGLGTTYTGAHIGAFGVPVVYQTDPGFGYVGAVELPDAPENRVIVIAGGEVTGDYMVRNGEATILGGYDLPSSIDDVGDLVTLGLNDPVGVRRDALRNGLDVSAEASARTSGWVGTLADPITVDLVYGSVDILGRNGVAVRTIENPSLVYPFSGGAGGTARSPSYAEDSFALLESEAGDVALVGNDAVLPDALGARVVQPIIRVLPPILTIKTGTEGPRAGDLVQLEDFTLFPSARGGLTLDVAGQARTANGVASGSAVVTITGNTTGAAADMAFTIPSGTRLRDPETGLIYTVQGPITFRERDPALEASVTIDFVALPGFEDQEILIPDTTRVEAYNGTIYKVLPGQRIEGLAKRVSTGEVRFVPTGGVASQPIDIPAGAQMTTPGGAVFEVVGGTSFQPGDRAKTVQVRALSTSQGVDARAGELRLVTPIAGIGSATNRSATQRAATATVNFIAEVPGQSDPTSAGRIKSLLTPVPGARFAYAEAPNVRGGNDQGTAGSITSQPTAVASVVGPVGDIRTNVDFEIVDAHLLPPGVRASDVHLSASTTQAPGSITPAISRELGGDGRPDLSGDRLNVVDPADVWLRTGGGSVATIRQSDADPRFDARNLANGFDYARYYAVCHSGAPCAMPNPLNPDESQLRTGRGPTHRGDREPASLVARRGFERIGFELAEAATLRAGPDADEEFDGTQADIIDVTLATQHANPGDVTRVLAPYGDIQFASVQREVRDEQTGLMTQLPGNFASGVTVSGPGSLVVASGVSVAANGTIGNATRVGGTLALSDISIGLNASARGIETIGNLGNPALAAAGAAISIVTAGDIQLNDRGAIDTLQGGDITIRSLEGSLLGGEPEDDFTAKRGIFTLYVPGIGEQASGAGGGNIVVDVAGSFNIGKSVTAALSGGDISLTARTGSVSAGSADPFKIISVSSSPTTNLPEVIYEGGGIFASSGNVVIDAGTDVDIGAGITAGAIAIVAGGNINAGQGSITSSGNISIDAGGSISGTISASGAISIGSGSVSQSASLSAGGLVVGAGSVGSNTGPGKVGAESNVASARAQGEAAAASNAVAGGTARRSGVSIDVTSRPVSGKDCEEDDPNCDEG